MNKSLKKMDEILSQDDVSADERIEFLDALFEAQKELDEKPERFLEEEPDEAKEEKGNNGQGVGRDR